MAKHYDAMHLNNVYTDGKRFDCPKSEEVQKTTVSIPMNECLTNLEIEYIISKVKKHMRVR